ncbi:5682_t:CDS:2 [Entrophospora sp. SA101]|nr:5682_t:CDS:2 [Entrophospora sp. SA101]
MTNGYDVQLVNTTQPPDGHFGQVVLGQQRKFDTYGMVTIVSNFTGMQLYIDPSGPPLNFYKSVSCFDAPVQRCRQELKTLLLTKEILCLGITNPTSMETKFTLSISFTSGVPIPVLNIPPVSGTITSSTTGPIIVVKQLVRILIIGN